ncbi:hypothetical protein DSO57_1030629 [Entomophthora muscae]|uniref:Uncharacterized protein n=1 Tax=Entomophthora muscae TaxID=34485 RepID=A0ACC2S2Z0_9FUNG|nr:hypothetical protein DSO57_1030629 [Entomophthora muscae]
MGMGTGTTASKTKPIFVALPLKIVKKEKGLGRALSKPSSPQTIPDSPNNEYLPEDVDKCPMIQVPLEDPVLYTIVRHPVGNCTINAILIWPSNIDSCKDLTGFAFKFGNSLPSVNGSEPISIHSGLSFLSVNDPGMNSSQRDPLSHSVFLMSDHCPLSTI